MSWDGRGRDNTNMLALSKATLVLAVQSLERRWADLRKNHCPLCLLLSSRKEEVQSVPKVRETG